MTIAVSFRPVVALADRARRRRTARLELRGPDAERVRTEIDAIAVHERALTDTRNGFPGPPWIGMR